MEVFFPEINHAEVIGAFGIAVAALNDNAVVVQFAIVPQHVFLQTAKHLIVLAQADKVF